MIFWEEDSAVHATDVRGQCDSVLSKSQQYVNQRSMHRGSNQLEMVVQRCASGCLGRSVEDDAKFAGRTGLFPDSVHGEVINLGMRSIQILHRYCLCVVQLKILTEDLSEFLKTFFLNERSSLTNLFSACVLNSPSARTRDFRGRGTMNLPCSFLEYDNSKCWTTLFSSKERTGFFML